MNTEEVKELRRVKRRAHLGHVVTAIVCEPHDAQDTSSDIGDRISLDVITFDIGTDGSAALKEVATVTESIGAILSRFSASQKSVAIDMIYSTIDSMLIEKRFAQTELFIRSAIQNNLPLSAMASLLTATRPWRNQLIDIRNELVDHMRDRALAQGGEQKVASLLGRLGR